MTNEQTAVLLRRNQAELKRVLDEISDSLPDDIERFTSKNMFNGTTTYGYPIVMGPLIEYIEGLGEDITMLTGKCSK